MIIKTIINLILLTLITIFQLSFISGLPEPMTNLNLIIVVLIFTIAFNKKKTIWFFVFIGFLFDIYSNNIFGFFTLLWPLIFLFSSFLATSFFTNRSLYSFLGLTLFATLFYNLAINLANYTLFHLIRWFTDVFTDYIDMSFFLFNQDFWLNIFYSIVINLVTVFLFFHIINFVTHKMKPVFLFKK